MVKAKHAGGRPTKYDPIYIKKVDEYLETTGREQTSLAKIVGFALYIGVSKSTLWEWSEKYKEFSSALDKIMEVQENTLIDDGIYGGKEVNATIVKLLLMNNHGMREKNDTTSDGKALNNLIQINESHKSIGLADPGPEGQK